MTMGTATQADLAQSKTGTADCSSAFGTWTATANAAATPVPLPFILNSAGATGPTLTGNVCEPTATEAVPVAVASGTTKLTCVGEEKRTNAAREAPAASATVTVDARLWP